MTSISIKFRNPTSPICTSGLLAGWLVTGLLLSTGCSSFQIPSMNLPPMPGLSMIDAASMGGDARGPSSYVAVAGASLPSSTFTEEVYYKVKQAKQNQSIVLQVIGDDAPLRVLPLPSATGETVHGEVPTVYVSTLLKQTGLLGKLGKVKAALYRASPENFEGVRMDVLFNDLGDRTVRPETDYALHPGDRLVIGEDDQVSIGSLFDLALGR